MEYNKKNEGNTAQSTPDGFAAHLLLSFPSSCTKTPCHTQSMPASLLYNLTKNLMAHLHDNLCAVLPKIIRRKS
ncbi:MAG: hypothetical protein LUG91_08735 [Ruminococcus sp.]|nr:hypothetical protein [Ruminococcus sp.]